MPGLEVRTPTGAPRSLPRGLGLHPYCEAGAPPASRATVCRDRCPGDSLWAESPRPSRERSRHKCSRCHRQRVRTALAFSYKGEQKRGSGPASLKERTVVCGLDEFCYGVGKHRPGCRHPGPQVPQTGGMCMWQPALGERKGRYWGSVLAGPPSLGLEGPHQYTEWLVGARTFQFLSTTLSVVLEGSPECVCGGGCRTCMQLVEGWRARPSGNVLGYQGFTFTLHLDNPPKAHCSPLCPFSVCPPLG